MIIKETHVFTQLIQESISDDEYRKLQEILVHNPTAGEVIRGSGGLRKLRWNLPHRGKRGGIRLIYYYWCKGNEIYMIYVYKKSEQDDLTASQLKRLKQVIDEEFKK